MCRYMDTTDPKVVDGKYLCLHNISEYRRNDLTAYVTSSLEKIPLHQKGKTMFFCAKKKRVTILEDVSTGETLNRSLDLFVRVCLEFDESGLSPKIVDIPYDYPHYPYDPYLFYIGEEMMNLHGEMLLVDDADFKDAKTYGINDFYFQNVCPEVCSVEGVDCIRLMTGYYKTEGELVDCLTGGVKSAQIDYGSHTEYFRSITVKQEQIGMTIYNYFSLEGVKSLIRECAAK